MIVSWFLSFDSGSLGSNPSGCQYSKKLDPSTEIMYIGTSLAEHECYDWI